MGWPAVAHHFGGVSSRPVCAPTAQPGDLLCYHHRHQSSLPSSRPTAPFLRQHSHARPHRGCGRADCTHRCQRAVGVNVTPLRAHCVCTAFTLPTALRRRSWRSETSCALGARCCTMKFGDACGSETARLRSSCGAASAVSAAERGARCCGRGNGAGALDPR